MARAFLTDGNYRGLVCLLWSKNEPEKAIEAEFVDLELSNYPFLHRRDTLRMVPEYLHHIVPRLPFG
jgi:hypothetical protein